MVDKNPGSRPITYEIEEHGKTKGSIWMWLPQGSWVRQVQRSSYFKGCSMLTLPELIVLKEEESRPFMKASYWSHTPLESLALSHLRAESFVEDSIITGNLQTQAEVTAVNLAHLNPKPFQRNVLLLVSWILWCDVIAFARRKLRGILAISWTDWLFITMAFPSPKLKIFPMNFCVHVFHLWF